MKQILKFGRLWVVVLSLLTAILAIQLVASNALAGKGGELGELENRASRLARENQLLRSNVAEVSSLSRIASQSAELGLAKPESIIYVDLFRVCEKQTCLSQPVAVLPQ